MSQREKNDLPAAIVPNVDSELMAVGYTSVEGTQLPSLTLSSEKNYSDLVIRDNIIQLTAVFGTVYTPQNGPCATLLSARKRILVAGVTVGAIMRVCAGSSVTTWRCAARAPICCIHIIVENMSGVLAVYSIACVVAGAERSSAVPVEVLSKSEGCCYENDKLAWVEHDCKWIRKMDFAVLQRWGEWWGREPLLKCS